MSEFPHEELCRILQSTDRTHDDVQFIYENIQKLQFFKDFFTENMAATSMESILALCEGFTYEKSPIGKYVLKKGDTSNDKFYVILSGQVAVVLPENDVAGSLTKDDNSLIKETENYTLRNVDQRSIIKLQTAGNISFSKMNTIDLEGTPSDKGRKNDGKILMSAMSSEFSPAVKPIRILRTSTLSEVQVERSPSIRSKRASRRTGFFHRSISMANDGSVESGFESFVTSPQLGVVREEENAPSLLKLNQIMEEEIPFDLEDDYKFEEYANKHGNIVRYLEKGETFGELALQNSNARSASILCRTDCEFLVGTKQQFEVMFERRDQEKERFFKSSFPLLANIVVSTAGFNYFLSTYKPEVFTKGTYLMNEGRVKKKDAKLYIIVKGECLIERTLIFEVSSPYNKAQSIAKNVMSVRLAVVGKGSVIGEELLLTRNNYRYSVKVTSDNLHVYAVTKEDFETKNFKEFRDHIIGLCRIKNEQRENIFENALREQEAKTQQYKAGNVYCIKNAAMQPLLIKPAMHGLSRYMHREQKVIDSTESPLASFFMTTMPGTKENSLSPPKNEEKSVSILDTDFSATKVLRSMKDKKRNAELSEIFHERDQSLEAKLAFLDRIPDFNKKSKDFSNPKEFENLRLFTDNENSQTKSKKFLLKKPEKLAGNESSADNTIISKATGDSKGIDSTVQWMLKELTRCKRKHRYSSSQEIEPKQISQMPQLPQIQIQKAEDKGQGPVVEEAQRNTPGSAIFSMRKNSAVALESTKNLKSSTPSITDLQTPKPTTASTPALRIPIYPKGYLIAKPFALAAKKETTLSTEASPLTTETPASAKMKLVQASDIIYQEQERRPRNPGHSSFYKTHTDSLLNLKSIEQSDIEDSPTNNQKYKSFYIHTPDVSPCRNGSAQSPEKNQRLHSLGHSQSKSNLRRNRIRFYNPIEERKKFFEHPYIGAKPKVKKISAKNLLMVMSPTSAGSNLLNKK